MAKRWKYGHRPGADTTWWRPRPPPAPWEVLDLADLLWSARNDEVVLVTDRDGIGWRFEPGMAAADPHLKGTIVRLSTEPAIDGLKPIRDPDLAELAAMLAWGHEAQPDALPPIEPRAWRALNSRHPLARRLRARLGTDSLLLVRQPVDRVIVPGPEASWLAIRNAWEVSDDPDERWLVLAHWSDSEDERWGQVRQVVSPVQLLDACVDGQLGSDSLRVASFHIGQLSNAVLDDELLPAGIAQVVDLLDEGGIEHSLRPKEGTSDADATGLTLRWAADGPEWVHPPLSNMDVHTLRELRGLCDELPLMPETLIETVDAAIDARVMAVEAAAEAAAERARQRAETARLAKLAAEEAEQLRLEAEAAEAERLATEKAAAEEQARVDAERAAAEEAKRLEDERLAEQERAAQEAEREAARQQARLEAEKAAEDERARQEAEKAAEDERTRREAEKAAEDERARREAEKAAEDERTRMEAEKAAAEERARREAEKAAEDERTRREAEKAAAEERARREAEKAAAEEEARREAEQAAAEEEARLEAEKAAAEEMARMAAERATAEEQARAQAERTAAEAEAAQRAKDKAQAAEQARLTAERAARERAHAIAPEAPQRVPPGPPEPPRKAEPIGKDRGSQTPLLIGVAVLVVIALTWWLWPGSKAPTEPADATTADVTTMKSPQDKRPVAPPMAPAVALDAGPRTDKDTVESDDDDGLIVLAAVADTVKPDEPPAAKTAPTLASGGKGPTPRFAALPWVSLWDGDTIPVEEGIAARCNRYGDVELRRGDKTRYIICDLFHTEPGRPRGNLRRKVCATAPVRCVDLKKARLATLPAYICTPKSGFAYGLLRIADPRRAIYVSETANKGDLQGRPTRQQWRKWCGGYAPYVFAMEKLR